MTYITEAPRKVPVIAEADLCVVGGSATGVFAAVRAARLGLRVVLVERANMLGGTAVLGLVNYWHSIHDADEKKQIIAGLTEETLSLLKKRGALLYRDDPTTRYNFNPWELTMVLDGFIRENAIRVMLHTSYAALDAEGDRINAVFVENGDGLGAIKARFFIDATGDGRLARDMHIPSYTHPTVQPPSACFHMQGNTDGLDLGKLITEHGAEFGLENDWGWNARVAGCDGITLRADNHVFGVRCDRAEDLTFAETEGRRQADAFVSLLRKYGKPEYSYAITALCAEIGIRETVHYVTRFKADRLSLLTGKNYPDPILYGSYRVDIHHSEDMGITFQYLDGKEEIFWGKNTGSEIGSWREREGITAPPATYYQLPFSVLVADGARNMIPVGRMLNADEGAFGALRVMVNLNQLGEAAGVAAYLAVHSDKSVSALDGAEVTRLLRDGGSAL